MLIYNIINKKANKKVLTKEEIDWVVEEFVKENITDAQMSSLLMAILLNGMNDKEAYYLTKAMQNSGKTISFNFDTVDKHSTGGVSDSTTIILAPLLSNMGLKLSKMSGRSLGTTGGTIDKLEVFEGYQVNKDIEEFKKIIKKVGASIISQTEGIAVADKKIYALRDSTATVASIPLIASSVMCKKLAMGSNIILLDVKYGTGAFMKTKKEAIELAKLMVKIGKHDNKKVWAAVTNMNIPLADGVGSALEVYSVIQTLKGKENYLKQISMELASNLYIMATNCTKAEADNVVKLAWDSDKLINKLKEIVIAHGGKVDYIDEPEKLLQTKTKIPVVASKEGFINSIDALCIAECVMGIKSNVPDNRKCFQGVISEVVNGQYVKEGQTIATIYCDNKIKEELKEKLQSAYIISKSKPRKICLIEKIIK